MADNTTLNAGSGGDTIRTDDLGSVKVPVSKIMLGGDGLDLGFVTGTNPFPVMSMTGSVTGLLAGGQAVSNANPVPVSQQGTVTVAAHSITSGSLTGLLVGGVAVSNANGVPITDAGGSLTIDGSVTVASGSVTGLLVGGVAASAENRVPVSGAVSLIQGGAAVGSFNALYVQHASSQQVTAQSGSVAGLLVGGVAVSNANPVPISDAGGSLTIDGASTYTGLGSTLFLNTFRNHEPSTVIVSGTTGRVVQYANSQLATGSTQIVAPQGATGKVRLLSAAVLGGAAGTIRFQSTGSAGTITNLSGYFSIAANGGFILPHSPHGWAETVVNEGLNVAYNGSGGVGLMITWLLTGP